MNEAGKPSPEEQERRLRERLVRIEMQSAFQEDTIDKLNQVIVDQELRLASLEASIRRILRRMERGDDENEDEESMADAET